MILFIGTVTGQANCPVINSVTNSGTVCKASNITLSVNATSPDKSALSYIWYKNGVAVGNGSQFTISGFSQSDATTYSVQVVNACETPVNSNPIILTLADIPTISPISNYALCEGASQTIAATVSSNNGGALSYTWSINGSVIPLQTKSSLDFSPVSTKIVGAYSVAASNSCGVSSALFNVNVKQIPVITVQPVALSVLCTNNNLQLNVTANTGGTDIIQYQWYKDAVLISGATSSQYIKNNVTTLDAGTYLVTLQNSCGFTQTSTSSTVTVGDIPSITAQPVSNSLCMGTNASVFNVAAQSSGGGVLNYQWLNAGIPINGATSSIYTITSVQSTDASNSYSVRVSNSCGLSSNASSIVSLTVNQPPTVSVSSNNNMYCSGTSGNITFSASTTGAGLSYVWYKGQSVVGTNSATLQEIYTSNAIDGTYSVTATNTCGQSTSNSIVIQAGSVPQITADLKDQIICSGSNVLLGVVVDTKNGGPLIYTWTGPGILVNQNASQYTIPSFISSMNGTYAVSVSNNCGTAVSKSAGISVQNALTITAQPQSVIVCKGASNTLSVVVGGNLNPVTYTWILNGNTIPNANSANLILNSISTNSIGNYQVQITSSCGNIISNVATVSIYDTPIFTVSPTNNQSICTSGNITLSGTIAGANNGTLAAYIFTWNHNSNTLSGNNIVVSGSTTTFSIANAINSDRGIYQIAVTDACGNTQLSNIANVDINAIPVFTINPSAINICVTQSAALQAAAQNSNGSNLPISYQWELNGIPIGSAINPTYSIVSMSSAIQGTYHVKATNSCGTTVSSDAIVNNVSLPNLISKSPDLALCNSIAQTATLNVVANTTNGVNPTIVWSSDYGSIQGTNLGNSIQITATSQSSKYTITLTNACGVYLDQLGNLPNITVGSEQSSPIVTDFTQSPNTTFCEFSNMTIGVKTLSTAPTFEQYTWKLNSNVVQNPINTNSGSYIKNTVDVNDAGTYTVNITNSCGTLNNAATIPVTINPTPIINFLITSAVSQCESGNYFTFNNTSTNTGANVRYQWDYGDGTIDNSSVSTAAHSYLVTGAQNVILTGINSYGCSNLNTQKVYVQSSPVITQQPLGGTVCGGSKFVLTALVSNSFSNSVSYQWANGNTPISGANSNEYTINSMSAADAGTYTLSISNNGCRYHTTSQNVLLKYQETPQPNFTYDANAIPTCLNNATFNFKNTTPALTNGTATYIWTYSDGTIDNNVNSTHQFTNVGIYSVSLQAINGGCSSNSKLLDKIVINGLPIISNNLSSNQAIPLGGPVVNLMVSASSNTGDGTQSTINYQWYQTQSSISGANAATYSINTTSQDYVGDYYVLVSNGCGSVKSNVEHITMVNVPILSSQPLSQQICIGKSVSLTVSASSNDGTNPIYQWYFQASPSAPQQSIFGATNSIYTIQNFIANSVGYYSVAIKNTIGTVNSNVVFIGDETAPQINSFLVSPSNAGGLCINSSVQFNAQVQSKRNSAYTVTWIENNVVLNQQNQLQLTLSNLQTSNTGNYIIRVTNACGAASDSIPISVIDKPKFGTSLVSQIKCMGSQAGFNATIVNANNNLPLNVQWFKDGLNYSGTGIIASNLITINNLQLADSGQYAMQVSNICGVSVSNIAVLSVVQNPVISHQPASTIVCAGNSVGISILANSSDNNLNYQWYKNGNLIPSIIGNQISFSAITIADNGIFRAEISNGCNQTTTSNSFQITVNDIVSLQNSIADKNLCSGVSAIFDLTRNLNYVDTHTSYQWELNGLNIPDPSAQTSILQIPAILNANAGNYSLLSTNNCGTSLIPLFNLIVSNKPAIIAQPISATICERTNFVNTVSVSTTNNTPYSYQWNLGGNAIVGATGPQYIIGAATINDQGMYSVTLQNICGVITSSIGNITIRSKPASQIAVLTPTSQCLLRNSFSFNSLITITDNTVPFISWDLGDGVFENTAQITHNYISANDFKVYLYTKSMFGCIDTTLQTVSVNTAPMISVQPSDQNICSGGVANFTVGIKLKPNEQIGYQWYYNDQLISGAINSTYTIPVVNINSIGTYKSMIQNVCGISYSNSTALKIADKPLITVSMPGNEKVCLNTSYTLKPVVYSLIPNYYQWYKNDLPMVGQMNDSLYLTAFTANDNARYRVSITNNCGTINSSISNLILRNIPASNQVLYNDTICYFTSTTIKHSSTNLINNDDTIFYRWFKNGVVLGNISSNSFAIPKFALSDTGLYTIQLGNNCGIANVPIVDLSLNKPVAGFRNDTIGSCTGKLQVSLNDTSNTIFPVRNYYWHIVENNISLNSLAINNYQFNVPGRYTILHSVFDSKGCSSDTVNSVVTNFGKPTAKIFVGDTCFTNPTIAVDHSLVGYGSTKLVSYRWNYGDTVITSNNSNPIAHTYKTAGKKSIQLMVSSDSSCVTDTITQTIMIYGNPQSAFITKDSCEGFPVLFTNKSSSVYYPDSTGSYVWNFGDSIVSNLKNPQYIFNSYGSYKIKLISYSATCPFLSNDTTINFRVKPPRADSIYPIINTINLNSKQLHALNGGRNYSWNPFKGLSDAQVQDPFIDLKNGKTTYTITIVDSAGCVLHDQQEVWAFPDPAIYLATAFSPNGDGINDYYQPQYVGIQNLQYFRVADKNNRQLFITNSMNDKWDGKVNGNSVPSDAYVVTVLGIDINGKQIFNQSVIVIVK